MTKLRPTKRKRGESTEGTSTPIKKVKETANIYGSMNMDMKEEDMDFSDPTTSLLLLLGSHKDEEANVDLLEQIKFQGFDPIAFRTALSKMCADKKQHIRDMKKLCLLFSSRGTKVSLMYRNIIPSVWAAHFEPLIKKYKVQDNVTKGDPDVVTLARIAACYPEMVSVALLPQKYKFASISGDLPCYLRFPGAAALIPSDRKELQEAHKEFCVELDKLINKRPTIQSSDVNTYWTAAHKSNLYNDSIRLLMLINVDHTLGFMYEDDPEIDINIIKQINAEKTRRGDKKLIEED